MACRLHAAFAHLQPAFVISQPDSAILQAASVVLQLLLLFLNLVNLTFKLALRVKNYAVSINDAVVKQAVDFSHHELEAGKETDVVNRCSNIADKANSIVATAPPEYKITADLITQVTNAAAAIEPDRSERDVVGGTHSGATMQLNNLFATARTNLHILDDWIEGDADDDSSDFVRNYFIMHRTVDHKGGGGKKDDKPAA